MQFFTGLDNVHIFSGVITACKLKYMYVSPNLDVRNQMSN